MVTAGNNDLLTIAQAAERLGIHERHVRRLATAHGLGLRLGKRLTALTAGDVEALRAVLKPGMGRPKGR